MKILIIEDEYSLADAIAETLKKEKFDVTIIADGIEGEDEALTNIYDLKRYGLGLAIAKSTVEKYNGKIEVLYKDGFTIFKVSIPIYFYIKEKGATYFEWSPFLTAPFNRCQLQKCDQKILEKFCLILVCNFLL